VHNRACSPTKAPAEFGAAPRRVCMLFCPCGRLYIEIYITNIIGQSTARAEQHAHPTALRCYPIPEPIHRNSTIDPLPHRGNR